jgi:sensor histidine kinase YesM
VCISARVQSGLLKINIEDDGPGLTTERAIEGDGIGLRNTRDRLERLYGAEYKFSVRNREPRGVEVVLIIPLRFAEQPAYPADQ